MQVSSNTNNYQSLNSQQQAVIQPVPKEPTYSNKEIYEASNGNLNRAKDGGLELTPQGEVNLNNKKEEIATATAEQLQTDKDSQRETATNFLAVSSKKSQVEIYLAVATQGKTDSNNATADVISNLRDVQKQNNAVQAYATYEEAQNSNIPSLH